MDWLHNSTIIFLIKYNRYTGIEKYFYYFNALWRKKTVNIFHRKIKSCIETFIPSRTKQKLDKIITSLSAINFYLASKWLEDRLVKRIESIAIETRGIT